jgi:hypothetical protein
MVRPKIRPAAVATSVVVSATMFSATGCMVPSTSTHSATGTFSVGQPTSGGTAGTPTAAAAGSSVRDGKFEFRVLDVARATSAGSADGNPYMQVKPQGEFIIVTMSVANIGDEPQSYFGQNQKLIDSSGRQFGANSEANMWMNNNVGLGGINPGNSIQVREAFDVPPGTVPDELEVHDSMLSGGAHIRLA